MTTYYLCETTAIACKVKGVLPWYARLSPCHQEYLHPIQPDHQPTQQDARSWDSPAIPSSVLAHLRGAQTPRGGHRETDWRGEAGGLKCTQEDAEPGTK